MAYVMISGVGLGRFELLSKKVLDRIKTVDEVFIENYTGLIPDSEIKKIMNINKNVILLNREDCEINDYKKIFDALESGKSIVFLTEGDPMLATTHVNLVIELKKRKIDHEIVPSIGIICACFSVSGLQIYRLGEILTFPIDYNRSRNSIKEKILRGIKNKKHILVLFEMDLVKHEYITPKDFLEFSKNDLKEILNHWVVIISRLGFEDQRIFSCRLSEIESLNIGKPPWTMIIVSEPHIMEKEYLELIQYCPKD